MAYLKVGDDTGTVGPVTDLTSGVDLTAAGQAVQASAAYGGGFGATISDLATKLVNITKTGVTDIFGGIVGGARSVVNKARTTITKQPIPAGDNTTTYILIGAAAAGGYMLYKRHKKGKR